jgi:hypothetical protein
VRANLVPDKTIARESGSQRRIAMKSSVPYVPFRRRGIGALSAFRTPVIGSGTLAMNQRPLYAGSQQVGSPAAVAILGWIALHVVGHDSWCGLSASHWPRPAAPRNIARIVLRSRRIPEHRVPEAERHRLPAGQRHQGMCPALAQGSRSDFRSLKVPGRCTTARPVITAFRCAAWNRHSDRPRPPTARPGPTRTGSDRLGLPTRLLAHRGVRLDRAGLHQPGLLHRAEDAGAAALALPRIDSVV